MCGGRVVRRGLAFVSLLNEGIEQLVIHHSYERMGLYDYGRSPASSE